MKTITKFKFRRRYVIWLFVIVVLVTSSIPFFGGSSGVQASECVIGSSSTCPATSPQEIYNLYGTTTNGTYWLRVGGVATQVYVIMDRSAAWGGGSWILLMKGTRGTTNFGYTSNLFTSNTTILNTSSLSNDVSTNAKFSVYNNLGLSQMLAVLVSPAVNGSIASQGDIANNNFGGHTWLESAGGNTAYTRLTTYTSLNSPSNSIAFSAVPVQKYRQTSSTSSTQALSYQTGTGQYGHNISCDNGNGYKARWGILWNNESLNLGSCDAFVGIGAGQGGTDLSPRDQVSYNDSLTWSMPARNSSGLGNFAFQIWGKVSDPSLAAPASLSVSTSGLNSVNLSWGSVSGASDYVVQYKLATDSTYSNSFVVTGQTTASISGLSSNTAYNYRVFARTSSNSSSSSATANHTVTVYTLTYQYNGATSGASPSSVQYAAGTTGVTLPTPLRTGYTFDGWYEASNFSGSALTSPYVTSATRTIYAKWTADTQTITYNSNTGTGSISNTTGGTDSSVSLSNGSGFNKAGYAITSWNTQSNGNGTSYSLSQSITMPVGGLSLFAIWTAQSQAITYNNNQGSGSIANTTANTDSSATLSNGADFSRTGYNLVSWNTQDDGNGTSYSLSQSITMPAGGLALYAIWESTLAITTPTSGLAATVDEAFNLSISTTGGSGGNSFSASSLPQGLSINSSTGEISGTPTQGGTTSFTVSVTDSSGAIKTTTSFSIAVSAANLADALAPSANAVSASTDSISVSWSAVSNASSYTLKIYDASDTLLDTISSISTTSQTIGDLTPSTQYKVSIQAIGDGISYASSAESSKTLVSTNNPVTVSIGRSLVNPYSTRQIRYTFTFSENITGFTTGNLTLSGTSTGWSLGSLTGSGSSYSITLTNSNPIDGTLDLALDNTGITSVATGVVGPNTQATTYTVGRITQVNTWIKFLWGEELQRF